MKPFDSCRHRRPAALAAAAAAVVLAGCNSDTAAPVEIRTLNTRADMVSGGDALVEIVMPPSTPSTGLRVDVDGRDVTSAFAVRGGRVTGLVTGLAPGLNTINAKVDIAAPARLAVTNAPRGGPVISGAQITPYFCATTVPQGATATAPATNASGLTTAATDAQCNIATEFKLYYKTTTAGCTFVLPDPSPSVAFTATAPATSAPAPTNPCFRPYTAGTAPADMASTTTDAGQVVPYIVRVERGTMNRGIYDIAVLFDPTKEWPSGVAPQAQWNGKILYQFGASTGQPRRQIRPAGTWTDDKSLSRGFMVVSNSMTDSLQNSNRVMMAETVMMMKEHIADRYGPIRFTIGSGCSGGSINSNMNASIAPGQLDGITISCTYPDSESTGVEVSDCVLLVEAYDKPAWKALMTAAGLTQAQINTKKAAINGHRDQTGCQGWNNAFGSSGKVAAYNQRVVADQNTGAIVTLPTSTNNCQLPAGLVYNATSNPTGARCGAWDWAASIFGRTDGVRARETRDNVGIQYGLKALLDGAINGEEFVTLNEIVGGTDGDNFSASRTLADSSALETAYRAGLVASGKQLAKTAIIDMRGYDDSLIDLPPGLVGLPPDQIQNRILFGIHHHWRSFALRDRLDRANGQHDNHVMWRFGRTGFGVPPGTMALDAFLTMDRWLTAVKADAGTGTIEQKVRSGKPAGTADYCVPTSDATQTIKIADAAVCDADSYLRKSLSPRQVAGGPLAEDILKCQLKPIEAAAYGGRLSSAQLTRLQAVFPGGICDWSKVGVGQQAAIGPLSFSAGPGGQALPAEPVSSAK